MMKNVTKPFTPGILVVRLLHAARAAYLTRFRKELPDV
jgi:hypothetical protein